MTNFALSGNNIKTALQSDHTIGSGSLVVVSAARMPALSAGKTFKVTVQKATDATQFTVYSVSAIAGTSLTVTAIESTSDQAFTAGDTVTVGFTSGDFTAVATALNTLEARTPKITAASQIAVGDVDLIARTKIGGGTPTDNHAAINTVLAAATATAPAILDVDGSFAVLGAIIIPDTGHCVLAGHGWDTGFVSMPGSNACTIQSASAPKYPFDPGLPANGSIAAPTVVQGNILIRDLKLDGYRGTYPNGNVSTAGAGYDARGRFVIADGPTYPTIDLASFENVLIDRVHIHDPVTYAIRLVDCYKVIITGCRLEAQNYGANTDGIHLDGCTDVIVSHCVIKGGDDGVAFNNDEGYQIAGGNYVVTSCILDTRTGVRVHGDTIATRSVLISDCEITTQIYALLIGNEFAGTKVPGTNESIRMADCTVKLYFASGNAYAVTWLNGSVNSLELDNITLVEPLNNGSASLPFFQCLVANITVDTCTIRATTIRNAAGNYPVSILTMSVGTIGCLRIRGWKVSDAVGSSYANAPYLLTLTGTASVQNVWIESCDSRGASAFCNDFTKIGTVSGPGVLASGFLFPDSVMAIGVLYKSATQSGNPICVKDATNVYPIAPPGSAVPYSGVVNHAHYAMDSTTNGAFDVSVFVGPGTPLTCAATAATMGGGGSFEMFAIVRSTRYYSAIQAIAGVWNNGPNATSGPMLFYANGPGKFAFITSHGSNAYQASGATTPTAATWYAVSGAHDATTNTNQLYLNAVADGASVATTGSIPSSSSAFFEVGGAYATDASWGHNGSIALVVGFAGILTSTQRTWLTNMVGGVPQGRSSTEILAYATSPGLPTILFGYAFENAGALGTDFGPNALTLTPRHGAPTQVAGPG